MGGAIGGMLLTSCTLPIVNALGNGSAQSGYQKTAALYAVIAVILNLIVVSVCKDVGVKRVCKNSLTSI